MELRKIEQAAWEQGWRVERTKKGHIRFVPPEVTKPMVEAAGTPSELRSIRNLLAQLRRSSLIWPWPPTGGRP